MRLRGQRLPLGSASHATGDTGDTAAPADHLCVVDVGSDVEQWADMARQAGHKGLHAHAWC